MPKLTREDALAEATRLIHRTHTGVLATVDEAGQPQMRWMGYTTLAEGLRKVYTLTDRRSRKVEQINRHPQVSWFFSSDDGDEVVSLFGRAEVVESAILVQEVWDRLVRAGHPYILSTMGDNGSMEMVSVECHITRLELLAPRLGIADPMVIELTASQTA